MTNKKNNTDYIAKLEKMQKLFETWLIYLKDKWLEKTRLYKYMLDITIMLWDDEKYTDEVRIKNTIEYVYKYILREYLRDIQEITLFDITDSAFDLEEPKDICADEVFELEDNFNPMKEYAFSYIHLTKVLEDITLPLWIRYTVGALFLDENELKKDNINMVIAEWDEEE